MPPAVINFTRLNERFCLSPSLNVCPFRCFEIDSHVKRWPATIWALVLAACLKFFGLFRLARLLRRRHETIERARKLRSLETLSTLEACVLKRDATASHTASPHERRVGLTSIKLKLYQLAEFLMSLIPASLPADTASP